MRHTLIIAITICISSLLSSCIGGRSNAGPDELSPIIQGADLIEIEKDTFYFKAQESTATYAYGVVSEAKARSGKFKVLTLFSSEMKILNIEVGRYPYTHGRGVKKQSFLKQFKNWDGETKVDSVSGATNSCDALLKAVNRSKEALAAKLQS